LQAGRFFMVRLPIEVQHAALLERAIVKGAIVEG
jgi:hypothetical protein